MRVAVGAGSHNGCRNSRISTLMNIILSRLGTSTIELKSGKSIPLSEGVVCVHNDDSGTTKVVPVSAKSLREKYKLTSAETKYAVRQVGLQIKQAQSAAFSALCAQSDTVGLGMKRTKSGAIWVGVKEVADEVKEPSAADTKLAKENEALKAQIAANNALLAALCKAAGKTPEQLVAEAAAQTTTPAA